MTEDYTFKKLQKEKPQKALMISYDQLCKQHSALDKKFQSISKDLKDLRVRCEAQDRELMKKQKTIEKLIEEKCELTNQTTAQKNIIRKLEAKIAIGSKGASDLNTSKHISFLSQEKTALEDELNSAYDKIEDLEDHIAVISRALELKAEEIGKNPLSMLSIGGDKEFRSKLKDKERIFQAEIDEKSQNLEKFQREVEDLKDYNEKLLTENIEIQRKCRAFESEKKALEQKVFHSAQEQKSLLEYIDELSLTKSTKTALFKGSRRMIEEKQLEFEELQMRYSQLEAKLQSYESEKSLDKPYKSVKFVDSNNNQVAELEKEINQKNAIIHSLKMRENELMSEIDSLKDTDCDKDKLEKALLDLEELKDEKEQLKEAMNEAINQCASSLLKQQNLEKENLKLQKQVENLANSKLLMQNTLADQINSLRNQVQRLKEDRNEQSIRLST